MSASSSQTHLPLTTQVGGHPGVLTTEDGVLLIKRALPREVAFYQSVSSDPALAQLYNFIPEFYGTLKLEGRLEHGTSITDPNAIKPVEDAPESEKDEYRHLILESGEAYLSAAAMHNRLSSRICRTLSLSPMYLTSSSAPFYTTKTPRQRNAHVWNRLRARLLPQRRACGSQDSRYVPYRRHAEPGLSAFLGLRLNVGQAGRGPEVVWKVNQSC